ncbi:hypothetical protein BGX34_005574 [Mortierella sp. NVP85]|nr:hypothetical protein BGX34_005574 [Mortierella sp. NVP85]
MPNSTNATTVQQHLRELQTLVQDSLKHWNLATDSTAASALAANPGRLTNGTLQRDYKEKIAAIRAICLSFAQGPLHQSLNSGDSSSAPAFRKYSSLLKEENTLDEALYSVKSSLKQCQKTISAASQDGIVKSDHLINTIRDMATELGLECYLDTGSRPESVLPVSTLTIGGNVIVIDIDIDGVGAILRVKVSYASEIHQDERIDRLLAHNLQCKCSKLLQKLPERGQAKEGKLAHLPDCSRDFDAFSKNLKALATLDSFSKKYPDIDFFHNIRSMDADLKELFRREFLVTGANEKVKIPFNRISIAMEEATLPTAGHLPLSRTGFLLSEEDTFRLNTVPYGSIMNDQASVSPTTILQQPLKWIVPSADAAVEAAYVAVLHPPVIVAEDVAKQLAALSNQAGLNTTMSFHKDSGYLTLQESLINGSTEQTQWAITLDQGPNAIRQCYSFDRTKNDARLIHRIPFTHISQVYICTKLLRQQVAFNTLFQSCFQETEASDETKQRLAVILPGNGEDKHPEVSIVIQTPQPPNMILASFLNPYTETNMVLEIHIEPGTGVSTARLVNMFGAGSANFAMNLNHSSNSGGNSGSSGPSDGDPQQERPFAVESETITKVLQTCDNIPILVRWILKRSLAWMKERHRHQNKMQMHLGRRASSYVEEGGILKRPRV